MNNDDHDNEQRSISSDESHSNSLSDEDEDSNHPGGGISLLESRAAKVERNNAFLVSLGLLKKKTKKAKQTTEQSVELSLATKNEETSAFSGILLPQFPSEYDTSPKTATTSFVNANISGAARTEEVGPPSSATAASSYFNQIQQILFKYPGRSQQVHQLASLLIPGNCGGIPIFVNGPSGTGKTSLLQSIGAAAVATAAGQSFNRKEKEALVYTHVNIATSRDSWIRQVYQSVQSQLQVGDFDSKKRKRQETSQHSKKVKRLNQKQGETGGDDEGESNLRRSQRVKNFAGPTMNSGGGGGGGGSNKRSSKGRIASTRTAEDMMVSVPSQKQDQQQADETHPATGTTSSSLTSQSMAMHALGLFLQQHLCLRGNDGDDSKYPKRRMILVLDQAELLFEKNGSSGYRQSSSLQPNVLGQLMLLPRTMGLAKHLTIVVVSNSLFLAHTRMNMLVEPSQSLATLVGTLQPIQIYFPVYQSKETIQNIFQTPRVSAMVAGQPHCVREHQSPSPDRLVHSVVGDEHSTSNFPSQVYNCFVRTFVATLNDTCKDMNELIRMGRMLWPVYIQPLSSPAALQQTYKHLKHQSADAKTNDIDSSRGSKISDLIVLEYLDRRAIPKFRQTIETCFCSIMACPVELLGSASSRKPRSQNNPMDSMSRPARYLLLAAYLCQVNRPERDRALFTIEKNGRPSRRKSNAEETTSEVTNKLFRLRNFPLERMLSIYVSLISLHEATTLTQRSSNNPHQSDQFAPASLQERFGEVLHHLQSLGVIQVALSSQDRDGAIRLSAPRYTCQITSDQAYAVAASLDFPLDRYIL
ncbi:hypothetical protein ACA910_007779 [Epithemia clementina (nom. ined.)]